MWNQLFSGSRTAAKWFLGPENHVENHVESRKCLKSPLDSGTRQAALKLWDPKIHGKVIRVSRVEDEASAEAEASAKASPPKGSEKRLAQKQQRRQRVKAKKQREHTEKARAAGLRVGKKKVAKKVLKKKAVESTRVDSFLALFLLPRLCSRLSFA